MFIENYSKIGLLLDIVGAFLISLDVFDKTPDELNEIAKRITKNVKETLLKIVRAFQGEEGALKDHTIKKIYDLTLIISAFLIFGAFPYIESIEDSLPNYVNWIRKISAGSLLASIIIQYLLRNYISYRTGEIITRITIILALPILLIPVFVLAGLILIACSLYLISYPFAMLSLHLGGFRQLGVLLLIAGFVFQIYGA